MEVVSSIPGIFDLPRRHGKLKDLKKFDAQYFGVTPKQVTNPIFFSLFHSIFGHRLLLVFPVRSLNPVELRGSRTGVKIQSSIPGPSFSVDTACSSSLCALQLAVDAIRQEQCDAAVVAGAHLTLTPTAALQFLRLGMLSDKGSCRSFDASGSFALFFHTNYALFPGITFPSGERQAALLEEVYREAGIDPNTVTYVETHGTGTKVGDPQEANAICQVVTEKTPFPRGIVGVNSFGFGGSNTHIILRAANHAERKAAPASFMKIVVYSGPNAKRDPDLPPLKDVQKIMITEPKQIYFVYSGMGSQWPGMARQLMSIPAFDESLRISTAAVKEYGLDVYEMLKSEDPELYKNNTLNCMLAITAIQVKDKMLNAMRTIVPDPKPPVQYPVPVGTPMIASMWRWDHSQDWPVIDGKNLSAAGGAIATFRKPVSSLHLQEAFLLDHVIDGRVLYPFTGHMVLAWKTIAKLNGVDFQKTPVIIEDIRVYNATIITKPSNIRIAEEGAPFYYNDFEGIETSQLAERIELDTEDAYKEFLLRGYEYGQAFRYANSAVRRITSRGIYRTCNSGERGMLYWTGNWITFLDSLLQTALLAERAYSLRLPTRVRYIRIDPVKHLEHIQERVHFLDGIQVIELRNDIATNGCVAGGVECCDLTAHTVARRLQSAGQLYHEKLYFITHFDTAYLPPFVIYELFKRAAPMSWVFLKGCMFRSPVAVALEEIFAMEIGTDMKEFEQKVADKMRSVIKIFDVDRLWSAALVHDRVLKCVQWACVGPNVDDMDESTLVQLGARKVKMSFDDKQFSVPSDARNFDIVILDKVLSNTITDLPLVSYRKKDPVLYLNRCKELLREDGFLILVEVTTQYEIALSIQGLLGTEMENLGEDRAFGTYYSHEQLLDIFKECDFRLCSFQSNRFRTIIDMSVKKENRSGPPRIRMEDEATKQIMNLDLHANNYRDGVWGSIRHIVVKEGFSETDLERWKLIGEVSGTASII
uniref:Fatty acid synthase n=1 Tax=Parascaris equorum TaxID=6256 RepID=A0A914S4R3_PAREQ